MSLSERFELFGLKRDDGARTFEAREIATGRPVLVHLLPAGSPLLKKLETLPEHERGRVIDRGEEQGGVYLVTDRLAEFAGLDEWLSQGSVTSFDRGGAWQVPKAAPPDSSFEDLFGKPLDVSPSTMGPTPVLTNTGEVTLQMPAPVAIPKPEPPKPEPGEFTRQFAPVLRPAPVVAPKAEPVAPVKPDEPGEFTRQFAPPVLRPTPPPAPVAPAAAKPKEAGEFTKLFQSPLRPVRTSAPAPAEPSKQEPGEFTQMLQAQRPSSSPGSPLSASQEGDFAKFFESPMMPTGPSNAAPITPPMPPKGPFQAGRGGEFTQVFGRGDIPAPPPVMRPGSPPMAPPPSPEITKPFEKPSAPVAPLYPPPTLPAPPPTNMAPQAPRPPGDYTRQFSAPVHLSLGMPGAPQAPVMPIVGRSAKRKSRLPLFLMLGAGGLLIIALIVYLMMRHPS